MADPARRIATYADLEGVPREQVGEILGGELYAWPRPAPRHANASSGIGREVGGAFHGGWARGPGGWWILDEPELHLSGDAVVPDLGGWRRERMPELPDVAWFALAPDWVCEVLSPSTVAHDRIRKSAFYARERVPWMWLVDPDARTLEVFALRGEHYLLIGAHEGDAVVHAEPFEEVGLELARWWG